MRILIAEDDFASRHLLMKFLSQYGECVCAVDGLETLDTYLFALKEENAFQIICLDIMMPKLDGLKVLKAIRNIEKQKQINDKDRARIIMTTALNDKKTVMEAQEFGCDAYAWKPLDLNKMKEVMDKLIAE